MTSPQSRPSTLRSSLAGKRVLFVASTGGHLTQSFLLAKLLGVSADSAWVTFENEQSVSLLAQREVTYVPYVAPRDVRGAVNATRAISALLVRQKYDAVLSTGAAVGVSAMLAARRRGVPAWYVESVARLDGPSLTGKIVSRIPGVRTFTQRPGWSSKKWPFEVSILDSWQAETQPARKPEKIFVTVGTIRPYRFDRLIDRLKAVVPSDVEIRWQLGVTDRADLPDAQLMLHGDAMAQAIAWADVVVTHSGVGSILSLLSTSTPAVVVPRRAKYGEHIDDHQIQIASDVGARGFCTVREADELDWSDLVSATGRVASTLPGN